MPFKGAYIIGVLFFFLNVTYAFGQQTVQLKGKVTNPAGEPVFGAVVSVKGPQDKATSADFDGNYALSLLPGTYEVTIEGFGLEIQTQTISLTSDKTLDVGLKDEAIMVEAIVVEAPDEVEQNIESTDMGKVKLEMEDIEKLPAFMGEVDAMKTLQLLPGVQSAGEGVSGIFVRGGSVDQNLILLDDAPLYNPSHLFGFFSVFNAGAIDNVTLYKGMIPAEYGGRLSSVVDFQTKDPNLDSLHAEGGIGIISSRLTLQAPIVKGKTGFMIAGRRTYIDAISQLAPEGENGTDGVPYYFQDYNLKLFHKFSDKDKLTFSGYYGDDGLKFSFLDGRVDATIKWGNITSALTWKHKFNDNMDLRLTTYYAYYRFAARTRFDNIRTNADSKIRDIGGKAVIDHYINDKHSIHYGVEYINHRYTPRDIDAGTLDEGGFETGILNTNKFAHEGAFFIGDDYKITSRLRAEIALRGSFFSQYGPYNTVKGIGNNADTIRYTGGEIVKTYGGFEPRLGLRYKLNDVSSLKGSIVRNQQYVHLASLSGNNLPFDVWIPSSDVLKPQTGIQYSAGYFRNFKDNMFSSSVELYYRTMNNVVDFTESYVPTISDDVEYSMLQGNGWAYGAEFLLRKEKGKLQGWIGYTLSWVTLQFDEINGGNPYPSRYDRRHDLSIVGIYEFNKKWTVSTTFVYGTGQPVTLQEGMYFIGESILNIYGPRNGYRMPAYHRWDLAVTWEPHHNDKRFKSSWTFALYNVYNRANPFFVYVDGDFNDEEGQVETKANMIYLFPILPNINWNFKF